MRGRIEKDGVLSVERRGEWQRMICPWDGTATTECCDRCPLFREELMKAGDGWKTLSVSTLCGRRPDLPSERIEIFFDHRGEVPPPPRKRVQSKYAAQIAGVEA